MSGIAEEAASRRSKASTRCVREKRCEAAKFKGRGTGVNAVHQKQRRPVAHLGDEDVVAAPHPGLSCSSDAIEREGVRFAKALIDQGRGSGQTGQCRQRTK